MNWPWHCTHKHALTLARFDCKLGKYSKKNLNLKSVRHRTISPPWWRKFPSIFLPHFFLFAIESYIYEADLRLVSVKNINFESSYNCFKYWHSSAALAADCQLLVYSAIFLVASTTTCVKYKAQTMCKTRFDSQGMILNGFYKKQNNFEKWFIKTTKKNKNN